MTERPTELEVLLARVPPETRAMVEALSRVCDNAERVVAAYQEAVRRAFPPPPLAWQVRPFPRWTEPRIRPPRREARRAHRRKLKRGR